MNRQPSVQPPNPYALVPPPPSGKNNRSEPLFTKQFPFAEVVTTSSGAMVPVPSHIYDSDVTMIAGYARNIEAVRELLAGTGLQPVLTEDGRAFVQVWINKFKDTSIGAYDEVMVNVSASERGRVVSVKNPMTAAKAALDPMLTSVTGPMLMHHRSSLELARERYGIDAHSATPSVEATSEGLQFEVTNGRGQPILTGSIPSVGGLNKLRAMFSLGRALGFKGMVELLWGGVKAALFKEPISVTGISVSPRTGQVVEFRQHMLWSSQPMILPPSSRLEALPTGEVGKKLAALNFEPQVAFRGPMQAVFDRSSLV